MSTAFPFYLAMTAAEMAKNVEIPCPVAWMACHFSCYGTGLSNLPATLPEGSMLIVNDRTPVSGHDPERITEQLQTLVSQLKAACILLDFQRPNVPETAAIARAILQGRPCPVGVAEGYAGELDCPVFLSPPPPDRPLKDYLQPWKHREIWLEAAFSALTITVTEAGSQYEPCLSLEATESCFAEDDLMCHYHIKVSEAQAQFTLYRTVSDLTALLQAAAGLGVTRAVGLYQELGNFIPFP